MKPISMALALCALLVVGGCTNDQPAASSSNVAAGTSQPVTQADLTPEQLGELGAAIRKNPQDAQSLLSQRGLNEQSFELAVRKVSEDPAAAKRYAEAFRKNA